MKANAKWLMVVVLALVVSRPDVARADMPGCDTDSMFGWSSDSFGPHGACCDVHDKCYADNGCTFASFNNSEGPACTACNNQVISCFAGSPTGPSQCAQVPGSGMRGTLCQDQGWNNGWYEWQGALRCPSYSCPSACGQQDGCGGFCPMYGYGWDCTSCFGCAACGTCACSTVDWGGADWSDCFDDCGANHFQVGTACWFDATCEYNTQCAIYSWCDGDNWNNCSLCSWYDCNGTCNGDNWECMCDCGDCTYGCGGGGGDPYGYCPDYCTGACGGYGNCAFGG